MGIIDIANAAMAQAMRLVSVQRGYDPRDFTLVAFGGAGPVHANQLAQELGIPAMLVPPSPGVASALGMLATDVRRDYRRTSLQRLDEVEAPALQSAFERFEAEAGETLRAEGFTADRIRLDRSLDLRYVGQSWKLPVPVPAGRLSDATLAEIRGRFDREHERQYGYAVPEEPVEMVNVSLSAFGLIPPLTLPDAAPGGRSPEAARAARRPVYFREAGGFADAGMYDRSLLRQGNVIEGPAIVSEMDATTVIHPGYRATVGRHGVLLLEAL